MAWTGELGTKESRMTNTPGKSEMKALERVERRLNNTWAKHGFMTLTVSDLREVVSLARASSRPPADQVLDMAEAANAVGSALDDWIRIVAVRNELNPDLRHYVWKRSPTYEEVQEAMRANNELAKAIAALQAVPASPLGRDALNMCEHGADKGSYCGYCGGYSKGAGDAEA